jgi:hypothetical protein
MIISESDIEARIGGIYGTAAGLAVDRSVDDVAMLVLCRESVDRTNDGTWFQKINSSGFDGSLGSAIGDSLQFNGPVSLVCGQDSWLAVYLRLMNPPGNPAQINEVWQCGIARDGHGALLNHKSLSTNYDTRGNYLVRSGKTSTSALYPFIEDALHGGTAYIWITNDDGATLSPLIGAPEPFPFEDFQIIEVCNIDPTGLYLMSSNPNGFYAQRSSDGGATWEDLTNLDNSSTALSFYCLSDYHHWMIGMDGEFNVKLWYTPNFGESFEDKTGDLGSAFLYWPYLAESIILVRAW